MAVPKNLLSGPAAPRITPLAFLMVSYVQGAIAERGTPMASSSRMLIEGVRAQPNHILGRAHQARR
jgi:hypothetical protein